MKKNTIAILIIAIIISAGTGVFLIKPMMADIENFDQKRTVFEQSISNFKSVKKTLEKEKIIQEKADMNKIYAILPDDPGLPDLLVQIQTLALTSGVAITNFSFNVAENNNTSLLSASDETLKGNIAKANFSTVGISIGISGVYQSIKSFISAVENNLRIMNILSLNINGPSASDSLEMSADFEIETYYETVASEKTNDAENSKKEFSNNAAAQ